MIAACRSADARRAASERNLQRARHPHDVDRFVADAVLAQRAHGAGDQRIDDARVPAARDDRVARGVDGGGQRRFVRA